MILYKRGHYTTPILIQFLRYVVVVVVLIIIIIIIIIIID